MNNYINYFSRGQRVVFLGDSIIQSHGYIDYIRYFFAARIPGINLKIYNCGIAGDTAAAAWLC
ncbi:MAG TPA: hypothetical protein VKS21_09285, partial [Spirochaetota bacterium]|nr:hypothetical protein [Spirochaetota bacterium]